MDGALLMTDRLLGMDHPDSKSSICSYLFQCLRLFFLEIIAFKLY